MTKCVIYCRVSTEGQEDNTSMGTQLEGCRAYAKAQGWDVVATFQEVYSGFYYWERKELAKALDLIRHGGADVLLVYKLDRLAREDNHRGAILTELQKVGATFDSATEDFSNTIQGMVMMMASSMMAMMERDRIRERTMAGKRARVRDLHCPLPGNHPPYGLQWAGEKKSRLVADPLTSPVVVKMFTRVAEGCSATALAKELTQAGIPTPRGEMKAWRQGTISRILKNRVYLGEVEAYKTETIKEKGRKRDGSEGMILKVIPKPTEGRVALPKGIAPELISPELFARVQAQLAGNQSLSKRKNRDPEATLLRAGLIKCGICGSTMTAMRRNNSDRWAYRCYHKGRAIPDHGSISISATDMDSEVEARLRQLLEDHTYIEQFVQPEMANAGPSLELAELERAIADRGKRIANYINALGLVEGVEAEEVSRKVRELGRERTELTARLEALQAVRLDEHARKSEIDRMLDLFRLTEEYFPSLTYDQKRGWLWALGFQVRVWSTDHSPRWEITSDIDPSYWETPANWDDDWHPDAPSVWGGFHGEPPIVTHSFR